MYRAAGFSHEARLQPGPQSFLVIPTPSAAEAEEPALSEVEGNLLFALFMDAGCSARETEELCF
jgi:hypothetical protein